MSIHFSLPTPADFEGLAKPQDIAVTVYVETAPNVADAARAKVAFQSAFDDALNQLEDAGISHPVRTEIAQSREEILDSDIWHKLSRSLAVFVAPGFSEVFVLPNRIEDHFDAGTTFSLGLLWRSVTQIQEAFALTLSANEWKLWHATPTARATELAISGDYPDSASDATNRGSAGRGDDRLSGDPYDLYAKRVADAAQTELAAINPAGNIPLFVFAEEQLLGRFEVRKEGRHLELVRGAADRLTAAEIDEEIRGRLADVNTTITAAELANLGEIDQSRVEHDLAAIAHLAAQGSVEAMWFDMTQDVWGTLNPETGEISYAPDDSGAFTPGVGELFGQIATLVVAKGGRAVAVRGSDLENWDGPVVAHLRFALT